MSSDISWLNELYKTELDLKNYKRPRIIKYEELKRIFDPAVSILSKEKCE